MNKEILFISVPKFGLDQYKEYYTLQNDRCTSDLFSAGAFMPLGLLSIDSYIKKEIENVNTNILSLDAVVQKNMMHNGVDNELKLINELREEYFINIINENIIGNPEIIGLSIMFDVSVELALLLTRFLRKRFPEAIIILGGHPVTSKYKQIFEMARGSINAISYGEGEKPFARLLKSADYTQFLEQDFSFVTESKISSDDLQLQNDVITDLDEIPMINYDLIFGNELFLKSKELAKLYSFYPDLDNIALMTSRGCPHRCTFCSSHRVHGRIMRSYSIDRIKKEIDHLVKMYGVNKISIKDDHFLFDVKRAIEICDYANEKGVKLSFPNGFAITCITKDFVECLVRNNTKRVVLALESGSERVLKEIMHKPLSLNKACEVFELFSKENIFVMVYCVVGFPGETLQDLQESLEFLNNQKFDWVGFSGATPISGSDFEKELNDNGVFPELHNQLFTHSDYSNPDVQAKLNGDVKMTFDLSVNYVNNGMMRKGKFREAEQFFCTIIEGNPNHAFAIYFRAKCLEKMGENASELMKKYSQIITKDSSWRKYAEYFGLG